MTQDEGFTLADMACLGRLFEEHRPRLLRMVRRRMDPALSARVDAEDVLSDSFLDARRKWRDGVDRPDFPAYAWLYRIVLDRLIETWRRETRAARDPRQYMPWPERSSVQLANGLVAADTSPSQRGQRNELQAELHRLMEELASADQEILWMRDFDRLSFREIGGILGVSENTATVRYVRAFRRLRELWRDKHGGDLPGERHD